MIAKFDKPIDKQIFCFLFYFIFEVFLDPSPVTPPLIYYSIRVWNFKLLLYTLKLSLSSAESLISFLSDLKLYSILISNYPSWRWSLTLKFSCFLSSFSSHHLQLERLLQLLCQPMKVRCISYPKIKINILYKCFMLV